MRPLRSWRRAMGNMPGFVTPMASPAKIICTFFMVLLLIAGQAVHAGVCLCHGHENDAPCSETAQAALFAACEAGSHCGHESSNEDCSCACHDLSTHAGDAVSAAISTPAPPFAGRPCISDLAEVSSALRSHGERWNSWYEAAPPSAVHTGFVCPLRS